MTTRFLVIAAIMVVAALACVLVPLLRSARREGRPRGPFVLALALAGCGAKEDEATTKARAELAALPTLEDTRTALQGAMEKIVTAVKAQMPKAIWDDGGNETTSSCNGGYADTDGPAHGPRLAGASVPGGRGTGLRRGDGSAHLEGSAGGRRWLRATSKLHPERPTAPIWNGRGNCDMSSRKRKLTACTASASITSLSAIFQREMR